MRSLICEIGGGTPFDLRSNRLCGEHNLDRWRKTWIEPVDLRQCHRNKYESTRMFVVNVFEEGECRTEARFLQRDRT